LRYSLLDRNDLSPIRYERVNRTTGKSVSWNSIVKGYEYEAGHYVVLTDDDFRSANVAATQTIDIVEFVEGASIDMMYFNKPFYVAPLKKQTKAYVLLRETLRRTGKVAIAKVVLHNRQHMAALVTRGPALVLNLLRFAN
ncbi:Ku protein, partial [Salmonella enterica]|uniref:non-homologous end joining protein Ku n=1 Tax=Salmonella enterica TaxID=28901 RepID=UPI00139B0487